MKLRKILVVLILVFTVGAWYAFRPERLFLNKTVNEQFPTASAASEAQAIASGSFHAIAHETKGTATIYRARDGKRTLRLSDFQTSNGPDVVVYLVAAPDAHDNETVTRAGYVLLGSLKGNIGDQNYEIRSDVDLNKYQSVSIWCRRFSVNFGTAPLQAKQS